MVETMIVGINLKGTTSKKNRDSSQAVGLRKGIQEDDEKEKSYPVTCSMNWLFHVGKGAEFRPNYTEHSETRMQ